MLLILQVFTDPILLDCTHSICSCCANHLFALSKLQRQTEELNIASLLSLNFAALRIGSKASSVCLSCPRCQVVTCAKTLQFGSKNGPCTTTSANTGAASTLKKNVTLQVLAHALKQQLGSSMQPGSDSLLCTKLGVDEDVDHECSGLGLSCKKCGAYFTLDSPAISDHACCSTDCTTTTTSTNSTDAPVKLREDNLIVGQDQGQDCRALNTIRGIAKGRNQEKAWDDTDNLSNRAEQAYNQTQSTCRNESRQNTLPAAEDSRPSHQPNDPSRKQKPPSSRGKTRTAKTEHDEGQTQAQAAVAVVDSN